MMYDYHHRGGYNRRSGMKEKGLNKVIVILVIAIILVGIAGGGFWYLSGHVILQGEVYPIAETTQLTITSLTSNDVSKIDRLENLTTVNAQDCGDYDLLMRLQQHHPDCQVNYQVTIDGTAYPQDTTEITITSLTDAEMTQLRYLPELTHVDASSCRDYAQLMKLESVYPEYTVTYFVQVRGVDYAPETTALVLENVDTNGLSEELTHLKALETLHLVNPEGDGADLLALRRAYPDVSVTWEKEICGITFTDDATEVDLSRVDVTDLAQLEQDMTFLPQAEVLTLGICGAVEGAMDEVRKTQIEEGISISALANEDIASLRDRRREDYKVVWSVICGEMITRTDAKSFMPVKHNVYYFHDEDAYNLRYCEEMEGVDLGHMSISHIEWVAFMPHLKYLILAHSDIRSIDPISNCKELLFLEIDWTAISDYTPLLGCTSLEDLNLGLTYGDATPIAQMTWLKNLWWKGRGGGVWSTLQEALPDTNMNFTSDRTVGDGWRRLQNYYDMRDLLGMEYMT